MHYLAWLRIILTLRLRSWLRARLGCCRLPHYAVVPFTRCGSALCLVADAVGFLPFTVTVLLVTRFCRLLRLWFYGSTVYTLVCHTLRLLHCCRLHGCATAPHIRTPLPVYVVVTFAVYVLRLHTLQFCVLPHAHRTLPHRLPCCHTHCVLVRYALHTFFTTFWFAATPVCWFNSLRFTSCWLVAVAFGLQFATYTAVAHAHGSTVGCAHILRILVPHCGSAFRFPHRPSGYFT